MKKRLSSVMPKMMSRDNPEYRLYKSIALYLKLQYPKVLYHFDPTGLNLSKAQSGMLKAIQGARGYPDLFIIEPRAKHHGLFLELKPEGTRLRKKDGTHINEHIKEQSGYLKDLWNIGFEADFAVGFDDAKDKIDRYLKL